MRPDGNNSEYNRSQWMLHQNLTYQRSWESRGVPPDWKLDSVVPIYMKVVRKDPRNYRTVNLTSIPGRITEKIWLHATERHWKDNAMI